MAIKTESVAMPREPMGIARLVDLTVYLLRRNVVPIFLFIGLIKLLSLLLRTLLATTGGLDPTPGPFPGLGNALLERAVSTVLLEPLAVGGVAFAVRSFVLDGRPLSLSAILTSVARESATLVKLGVVSALVTLILLVTLLLPPVGIVLLLLYNFVFYLGVYITLYERKPPIEALRRGWLLMRDDLWRAVRLILMTALLAGLIVFALGMSLGGLAALVDPLAEQSVVQRWKEVATLVGDLITTPLIFVLAGLYYFDLRIHFEGLDVSAAEARAAGEPVDLTAAPTGDGPLLHAASRRTLFVLTLAVTGLGLVAWVPAMIFWSWVA